MGFPIAKNLLQQGYQLRVYNRTASKADALANAGALVVTVPYQVAESGATLITMLSDDQAFEEVVLSDNELLRRLGSGAIHISMSTISPEIARRAADHQRAFGVTYVAAPVFGRPEAAADRKLWICMSGAARGKELARPLLEELGQGVVDFGEDPGAANVVKLAGNFLIASVLEALGEALAYTQKNEISSEPFFDLIARKLFASPVYQRYGQTLLSREFAPAGFRLELGLKDIDLILKSATSGRIPMPLASLLHDRILSGMAKGRSALDWSALTLESAESAGIRQN